MNTYNKLENVKSKLIDYNYELIKYKGKDISVEKVRAKILEILREV